MQTPQQNAIGTRTTPATLTDSYDDNKWSGSVEGMKSLHLDFDYTPLLGQTDRYIFIRIRYSNDHGVSWRERTVKTNSTTETKAYQEVPVIFPGAKLSTGGTTYSGVFDELDFTDELIEIAAKESGSGNNGTLYLGAVFSNN